MDPVSGISASEKPVIVGLYGIPGSGKNFLLDQLKEQLHPLHFAFFDGSEVIADIVPGGLEAFQGMGKEEKLLWRQRAINAIGKDLVNKRKVGVVTGHFTFLPKDQELGQEVYTESDLSTFTHIIYLDDPPEDVAERRSTDEEGIRPPVSLAPSRQWQEREMSRLRELCRRHGILFMAAPMNKVSMALNYFSCHTEKHNLDCVWRELDNLITAGRGLLQTVLIIAGDKTLAADDTGVLFWKMLANYRGLNEEECPLKRLFSSPLGYSDAAFRQATLLYEEAADDDEYDAICQKVARAVTMHPEFVSLLHQVGKRSNVAAVVVTCGLRRVWEKVLAGEGLSDTVTVIGGGRISDKVVVTPELKGLLVSRLRVHHQQYTWAFGSSPLELAMLKEADQAVVMVGEEEVRSKSMDTALADEVDNPGLQAFQVLLPSSALPRLDTTKFPLIDLMDPGWINNILGYGTQHAGLRVLHATEESSAKLLMTPMRDGSKAGPDLREAHRRVGWYLAIKYLGDTIGLEMFEVRHVPGYGTDGYRLSKERQTTIVAVMRGGEPMAFGVSDAFPLAMFVHASNPADVKPHHLHDQGAVVLVDSVVNNLNGKTVVEFAQHIRALNATVRIVVVTGVAKEQSIAGGSPIHSLGQQTGLSLVALCLSDNKFTGRGTTDTGNRLFNTTHLS